MRGNCFWRPAQVARQISCPCLFCRSIQVCASEVQNLRHKDLRLEWKNGDIASGELIVSKSKTAAGTGRLIPLSRRARACLTLWLSHFPQANAESYVFPFHKMGLAGNERKPTMYDLDMSRPTGSWRKAWLDACKAAGMRYRWHDLRHTFVSRLAESPAISEQTIRALAGHVSARCSNTTAISARRPNRPQSARSKSRRSSRFWRRQGAKVGTVTRAQMRMLNLTR